MEEEEEDGGGGWKRRRMDEEEEEEAEATEGRINRGPDGSCPPGWDDLKGGEKTGKPIEKDNGGKADGDGRE